MNQFLFKCTGTYKIQEKYLYPEAYRIFYLIQLSS